MTMHHGYTIDQLCTRPGNRIVVARTLKGNGEARRRRAPRTRARAAAATRGKVVRCGESQRHAGAPPRGTMRVVMINPNTTQELTDLMVRT